MVGLLGTTRLLRLEFSCDIVTVALNVDESNIFTSWGISVFNNGSQRLSEKIGQPTPCCFPVGNSILIVMMDNRQDQDNEFSAFCQNTLRPEG